MIILLTGANGLIGRKIISLLSKTNLVTLIATSIGEKRFELPRGVIYESFDISDQKRGLELFNTYRPDVVINSAAITQADDCESNIDKCRLVNVQAVSGLLNLSNLFNSFFLQISTDFVFNGNDGPYREEDKPDPISVYGMSKWESEELVMNANGNHAVARTILVYGFTEMMSRKNLVIWVIESLKNGKKIKVVSDQVRTPTLAEDAAMGCFSIVRQKQTGIFHIGGKDKLSPYDMAILTARCFNLDESLIEKVTTSHFPQPAKRPLITGLNIEKAGRILNYEPHSFEEGLELVKRQMKSG